MEVRDKLSPPTDEYVSSLARPTALNRNETFYELSDDSEYDLSDEERTGERRAARKLSWKEPSEQEPSEEDDDGGVGPDVFGVQFRELARLSRLTRYTSESDSSSKNAPTAAPCTSSDMPSGAASSAIWRQEGLELPDIPWSSLPEGAPTPEGELSPDHTWPSPIPPDPPPRRRSPSKEGPEGERLRARTSPPPLTGPLTGDHRAVRSTSHAAELIASKILSGAADEGPGTRDQGPGGRGQGAGATSAAPFLEPPPLPPRNSLTGIMSAVASGVASGAASYGLLLGDQPSSPPSVPSPSNEEASDEWRHVSSGTPTTGTGGANHEADEIGGGSHPSDGDLHDSGPWRGRHWSVDMGQNVSTASRNLHLLGPGASISDSPPLVVNWSSGMACGLGLDAGFLSIWVSSPGALGLG